MARKSLCVIYAEHPVEDRLTNPLAQKLASFTDLAEDDLLYLDMLCKEPMNLRPGEHLIQEGDRPDNVFMLVEGWACRYKLLPDGNRQIMAYLVPGDLCDIHIFILKVMDHGIVALTDARVAAIPKAEMLQTLDHRPAIARALFWATLVDEAVLREWLVNVGQRDAYTRLSHLFYELGLRLEQAGLRTGDHFTIPLTQEQLGDTVGLTKVHVNRVLQRMQSERLVSVGRRHVNVLRPDRLSEIADFDANYLHRERRS